MSRHGIAVRGPLDPDTVWERYAVVDRWPTWAPQVRSVECSAARLVAGASGRVRGPLGAAVSFVVDAVDEDARTWTWTVRSGGLRLRLDHGVVARAGGGTTATLVVHGPALVVLTYLPVAGLALARLVRRGG